MNILFLRHGQSADDLVDAFGGWADWELTDVGKQQIETTVEKIAALDMKFDTLLTSPLKRAVSGAEIIGKKLGLTPQIFEYVKERNTYGLMSGMVKADAKAKYPWLMEAYDNDKFVDGSEREEDIATRAKKAMELILALPAQNVIVVTHSMFMKAFVKTFLNKKIVKKEDGGYFILNVDGESMSVIKEDGIELA